MNGPPISSVSDVTEFRALLESLFVAASMADTKRWGRS